MHRICISLLFIHTAIEKWAERKGYTCINVVEIDACLHECVDFKHSES